MSDDPRYKSINLNEGVAITLPAHIWIGFVAAYNSTEWLDMNASIIGREALRQMLDPVYLKEQEAAYAQQPKSIADLFKMATDPPDSDPRLEPPPTG